MSDTPIDNPLINKMQKIIPGVGIRLPSKGLFYKNGELDDEVFEGEILVHPMTTLDEIIIRSPDGILSGKAIEQVISRCVPQVKKPLELFAKDVDYILVKLRQVSYGDIITVSHICDACGDDAETHEYPVNINQFTQQSKELHDTDMSRYQVKLDTGMTLHLRPSKFSELVSMYNINDDEKTPEEMENIITTSILAVVESVDKITDRELIRGWLKILPVTIMKEVISKISDANNWGPDFTYTITCKDCGKLHDLSYILNPVSFFTLPANLETSQS